MKPPASTSSPTEPATDRVRVRRLPARGYYDRALIDSVLDEGFVCHLGFSVDDTTWVLPTAYGRDGDRLYLHGATGNHALRTLAGGVSACVTVTLVDGLVLARSAFHHSINYRSVVVFGRAEPVLDPDEKARALDVIVNHVVPGRPAEIRPHTAAELRATSVLRLPIGEASAKVRTGGPSDDPEDLALDVWAGEIPLSVHPERPVPDAHSTGRPPPTSAADYRRPA